jgi:tetratricopeptide (TPR) repeat protein
LLEQLVDAGYREQGQDFMERNRALLERTALGQTAMGRLYMVQGEYQRATAQLSRALALGAPNLDAEFALGQANLTLGRFEGAADIFNRLVTFRPGYLPYYTFLGDAYRSCGRLMEALRVLEAAYRLNGASIPLIMNLARVYFDIGWLEKSRQLLLQARDLNPELTEIDINLGVVSLHMGELEQAAKLFESVAQRQVNPQAAYNNQANLALLQGDTRKAIKLYRLAEKSGDKNETVLYNLAQAYLRNKKYEEAMLWFDELLRIAPERIDVLLLQASITLEQGDVGGTELLYRKMLDLAPQDERVVKGLVDVLQSQQKFKDAAEVVEFYLVNFPNDMEFRFLGAELYRKMEWFEVALQQAEFLVRDFPDHYYGYLGSGSTLFDMVLKGKSKDVDNAIELLKSAAARMASHAQVDYYLGVLYLDFKAQPVLAREHLNAALALAQTETLKQQVRLALKRVKK